MICLILMFLDCIFSAFGNPLLEERFELAYGGLLELFIYLFIFGFYLILKDENFFHKEKVYPQFIKRK